MNFRDTNTDDCICRLRSELMIPCIYNQLVNAKPLKPDTYLENFVTTTYSGVINISGITNLLFISYKFVKGFFAITFLLLVISNWNFHDECQHFFLYNQKQNFSWIQQKMRNFHIDPHYKNRPILKRHVYRHDVTKVGDFYNGGLWGYF